MSFAEAIPIVLLLFGLEIVLSIDNVIVITILVSHLPEKSRKRLRTIGLMLALVLRLVILAFVSALTSLTNPLLFGLSIRDMIFLLGGIFLIWKAVEEIYNTVEHKEHGPDYSKFSGATYMKIVGQIIFLDFIFSFDSVITAVGMTNDMGTWLTQFLVMAFAVIMSYTVILLYANPVGEYIIARPNLKILALVFLVAIGVSILVDGFHGHIPKQYLYLAMGFSLLVQMVQMRYDYKKRLLEKAPASPQEKNKA